jgi:hypothetical protein
MTISSFKNVLEIAKAELEGAQPRLQIAQRTYREFVQEHGVETDGQFVYLPEPSASLRPSFDDEKESLEIELEAASRQMRHCQEVVNDLQLAAACATSNRFH